MEEKKSDEKPATSLKSLAERLRDAVESLRRKGKEESSDQGKAEDFLNRRR